MLSTAIIVFREIFEIAIILSVVLAATRGVAGRWKWVGLGIGAGAVGSGLVAFFAGEIADAAEGMGQEIFNAGVLFAAAAVIGWTVVWMKRHARELTAHLKKVGAAVVDGELPLYSVAVVIALAVLREGSEIVLLTYGLAAAGKSIASIAIGSAVGAVGGTIAGALFYYGILKVSTKHLFTVTSALLVLLASSMAAQGTVFLVAADKLPALADPLWDSSAILSQNSVLGQILHALIGYSDQPLGMQVLVFAVVLGVMTLSLKLAGKPQKTAEKPAKS
jgi:high-affinity iron transporter